MICDRILNSICIHEEHYEAVALALAKEDRRQNFIYQELHLDYPLNEEWAFLWRWLWGATAVLIKKPRSCITWKSSTLRS